MPIDLTVALCTYNPRPDLLTRAVRAVVSQLDELGDSVEFIIVDNNSEPRLQDADYLRGFRLTVIREPRQGLTAARAAAIRTARGRIILFVDDDNVIGPGYLTTVIERFSNPRLGVLGGSVVPEYETPPPAWLPPFESQLAIRRYSANVDVETSGLPYSDYFPVGAGMAVLRDVALAHLADTEKTGAIEGRKGHELTAGEDLDLDLFALSAGYRLKVIGALSLTHVIPSTRLTEEYISRLAIANVRSAVEVDRKWRLRFSRPIFDFLHVDRLSMIVRCLVFGLLSPLSVARRIKRQVWWEIRRLTAAR